MRNLPLFFALLVSGAFAPRLAALEPIKIGLLASSNSSETLSIARGAAIGIESAAARFRLAVQLIQRGHSGQWGSDGDEAGVLARDDEVQGIITSTDGQAAHQILQIAGRAHVPVVSLCSDSSITGAGIPWAVQIMPGTTAQAVTIIEKLKLTSWACLIPEGRTGRENLGDIQKAARHKGVQLIRTIELSREQSDFERVCERILQSKAEGILLWLDAGSASRAVRILRARGFKGRFAGPCNLDREAFFQSAQSAAEGFIIPVIQTGAFTPDRWRAFADSFSKQFGQEPTFCSAMAHDAVLWLCRFHSTGSLASLRAASPELEGVTGPLPFDEHGIRLSGLDLAVCHAGRFEPFAASLPQTLTSLP